jgi:hypothetical protein
MEKQNIHEWEVDKPFSLSLSLSLPIAASFKAREPICAVRRLLFSMTSNDDDVDSTWLQIARVSRKSLQFQTGTNAISHIKNRGKEFVIEKTKLLMDQGWFFFVS